MVDNPTGGTQGSVGKGFSGLDSVVQHEVLAATAEVNLVRSHVLAHPQSVNADLSAMPLSGVARTPEDDVIFAISMGRLLKFVEDGVSGSARCV